MAKRKAKKKMPCVRHSWSVYTEEERWICMCDTECTCHPPSYAMAVCSKCHIEMSQSGIEDALNELELLVHPDQE